MDRFWDEFSKSTITSGFLAIIIWVIICYLAVMQLPIPDILYFGGAAIIGFFFGAKGKAETSRMRSKLASEDDNLKEHY